MGFDALLYQAMSIRTTAVKRSRTPQNRTEVAPQKGAEGRFTQMKRARLSETTLKQGDLSIWG